jgi:predicted enzyme related to lactoylglutathione lyase
MVAPPATLAHVLYPATDVAVAVAFYRDLLDLPIRFVDGERFAMLGGAGACLAIAAPGEQVAARQVAASFKVRSVGDTVARAAELGATVEVAAQEGPHETRAVLRDPDGNLLIVYAPHSG